MSLEAITSLQAKNLELKNTYGKSYKVSSEKTHTISVKIFLPKTKASPEVGGISPTSIEMVVLLPAPLCPAQNNSVI